MSKDQVFLYVLGGLLAVILVVIVGTVTLSIIGDPEKEISVKLIGAIGSMFASVVALVLGYMVGRNGRSQDEPH